METPKWLGFFVKRYAVREAKKWRYAVRKAKIGGTQYAREEGSEDFVENLYFLGTNVLSVSTLILWYLTVFSIGLATLFKIGMYLLNREKRCNAFPRSTVIVTVLNELPTDNVGAFLVARICIRINFVRIGLPYRIAQ